MKALLISAVSMLALIVVGCGDSKPAAAGSDHDHESEHAEHVHRPKMGGQLVELGEEAFHFELLNDRTTGRLTLWVLDGEVENFLRVTNASFAAVLSANGRETPIEFKATVNGATGERVGDTSQFDAQADILKTTNVLSGRLPEVDIRGSSFTNVTFQFTP
jgi:hypothetical protein